MADVYRLHIDIPLGSNSEQSKMLANKIVENIVGSLRADNFDDPLIMQYRLGNDDDRQKRNHLVLDENGKCTTVKCRVDIKL